jgi:hypothetical protein
VLAGTTPPVLVIDELPAPKDGGTSASPASAPRP